MKAKKKHANIYQFDSDVAQESVKTQGTANCVSPTGCTNACTNTHTDKNQKYEYGWRRQSQINFAPNTFEPTRRNSLNFTQYVICWKPHLMMLLLR